MRKFLAIMFVSMALSSLAVPVRAGGMDTSDYPDWAKCAFDPRHSTYC